MNKKSIVNLYVIVLLLIIAVVVSLVLSQFINKNTSNTITEQSEKLKKIVSDTTGEKIILVKLSETPSIYIIQKILEDRGFETDIYTFKNFYVVYKSLDFTNVIFIGSSDSSTNIKLDKILRDLSNSEKNIVFIYDENSRLPLTLIRRYSVDIEPFEKITIENPTGENTLEYKIPTPIRHVKIVSSVFPELSEEIYVERGSGIYKKTPVLYLTTSSNVIVERKPNGLVTIDDIYTNLYTSDTLDSDNKFLYATWNKFTQPILFLTTKASSPSVDDIYVLCKKNPQGYYTSWIKVDSSGNISCVDLQNYKIGSVDVNTITIIDKTTGDTVAEIPWLVFASLDLSSGGKFYIFNPFVINGKIYPIFAYKDSAGKIRYIFDFLKESGNTFVFSREEQKYSNEDFIVLYNIPFRFNVKVDSSFNNVKISVKDYREDYKIPSIIKTTEGLSEIYIMPSYIFSLDSENNIIFSYIFGK